jgi:hypothetical protein
MNTSSPEVVLVSHTLAMPPEVLTDDQAAAAFVAKLVEHARSFGGYTITMTVTAPIARAFLANNVGNRDVRQWRVSRIKKIILGKRWVDNGQGFVVGLSGNLFTGQHRCLGIVAADAEEPGVAVQVAVAFGKADEARLTLDVGSIRSLPDLVTMVGIRDPRKIATLARFIWRYDQTGSIKAPPLDDTVDENFIREIAESKQAQIHAALDYVEGAGFPQKTTLAFVLRREQGLRRGEGRARSCRHDHFSRQGRGRQP